MADITVLVTCLGGGLLAQFIRYMKESSRHSVRVVGVDASDDPIARHFADVFETVPFGDDPSYADHVLDICERHGVDLVFPCSDEEALALSYAKDRFGEKGITVACNDPAQLEIITNKVRTYEYLTALDIRMPEWHRVGNAEEMMSRLDQMLERRGSAVVKSATDRGGRGIYVVGRAAQTVETRPGSRELHLDRDQFAREYLSQAAEAGSFVMERLTDPVHDLDILSWEGRIFSYVPRRRLVSSAPNQGHVVIEAPGMIAMGKKIVESLKLSWLFDIDIMLDSEGEPVVLEVNPRASGSVSVGIAAGMPLMDDLISLVKGEEVPERQPPVDVKIVAHNALVSF